MKAIFLCERPETLRNVFEPQTVASIRKNALLSDTVYSKEELLREPEKFSDVELIFSTWGMPEMTEEEIEKCLPSLKALFYAAGSVQEFARPFLARGVRLFSSWGANAVPVAEMTVAETVLANKGYYLTNRVYCSEGYVASKHAYWRCNGNFGETVGIIGAGMIGRLVIQMLKSYELRVIVFDPFLSDEDAAALGVEKCSLDELFARAFVVSNHLANNDQTKGMLNYALFSKMRENAVFINTGRGAQVVEEDLIRVLRERSDLTALLDVTEPEPSADGHPFYTLKNCFLTPHIAGSTGDEVKRMGRYMLSEFECFLSGERCRYEVTEKMLLTMA